MDMRDRKDQNHKEKEDFKVERDKMRRITNALENDLYKKRDQVNYMNDVLNGDRIMSDEEIDALFIVDGEDISENDPEEQQIKAMMKRMAALMRTENEFNTKIPIYQQDIDDLVGRNKQIEEEFHKEQVSMSTSVAQNENFRKELEDQLEALQNQHDQHKEKADQLEA